MTNELLDKNLSANDITRLIDKLDNSPFKYLSVENKDYKIVIGKEVPTEQVSSVQKEASVVAEKAASIEPAEVTSPLAQPVENISAEKVETSQKQNESVSEQTGVVTVTATTTGIYYAQPEPGAAPYVKVGDKIQADSTVGLIEIMKVYSAIPAGIEGEVVEIHVTDAQLVEYGDPLISVKAK